MNFLQSLAGPRRSAARHAGQMYERRRLVLVSVNTETARLLREQDSPEADRKALVAHLTSPQLH